MRDLLTGLAILLLLSLTGALIAPYFIDWDQRRALISEKLSVALGQELEVTGPIAVSLLPTPTLKLSHVRFKPGGALSGGIGRFRAQLAIPPLLRGDIRITDARLQGADLTLRPAAPTLEASKGLPLGSIGFDRLRIEASRLAVLRADGTPALAAERLEGQLEAASLLGPLRGALSFDISGDRRTLRLSTGRIEGGSLRIRALVENEVAAARSDFDGWLRYENGALSGDGTLAASGNAAFPLEKGIGHVIWRLSAKVRAAGMAAALDDVELALGNTDRQTIFSGSGDIDFARAGPVAKAILSTRQLDLDRLITAEDPRLAQTPEATVRSLVRALASGPTAQPWLSGDIEVSAGSLLFGGEAVLAPRVVVRSEGGAVGVVQLSAELPGRTQVAFESAPTAGASIAGRIAVESRDLGKLAGWYQGLPPRPQAIRSLKVSGDLRHGDGETRILNAALVADEMRLNGSILLQTAAARPKLTLGLKADQIDIAKLPELPESDQPAAWDLELAIDATRVRYAGVGAGDVTLRLRKQGEATLLDDLTIRNLDGADLTAKGALGGAAPRLDLRLRAQRMDAILQLADRLSSHWGIPVLATRAASLAPADLAMTWGPDGAGDRRLTAKGKLGETELDALLRVTPAGGLAGADSLDIRFRAASPAGLLRQIGLDAIPVASAGPVDLRLTGGGASARTPSVGWALKGLFGGMQVDVDARQTTSLAEPLAGRLRLSARDLAPAAQTLLVAVPAIAPGQDLQLDAGFDLRGYRITLRDMDLRSGGARIKGEIAFNLAEFGRVSGQLQAGRLDASAFAPLIFGAPQPGSPVVGWDRRPFGPAAAVTLPGDLWIEAEAIELGGVTIGRPRFVLRFDNGLMFVEHAEGDWLDGRLAGQATLRRNDASVSLSGRFALDNARLDRLPLPAAQALSGRAAAQMEFSAIGDGPAALVAALSGTGRLDTRDAKVSGLAPHALDALLQSTPPEFGAVTREALAASLQRRLQGQLALPQGAMPLALASGVLRAGPVRVDSGRGEVAAQAALDFRDFSLNARATLASREPPKGWSGPSPVAEVALRGPWSAPQREIDVSALSNGLTAIAIQREQERIEILEQDQRERGFFNRRLRAAEEQRRAEEEERRRLEAERRAAEEARRRAEEEEKRRIEEERRRAETERRALEAQRRAEEALRRAEEERQRRAEEAARREAARQSTQQRIDDAIRTVPTDALVLPPPPAPPAPLAP